MGLVKVNLGCGWRDFGGDWIHVDNGDYDHLDFKCDIKKLPFVDNYCDLIYSSHVIEYFDREEIKNVLEEWKRVLKPNGVLRLAVPNFEVMSKLYIEKKLALENILGPLYGKMSMDGIKIYHKTVYDFVSLEQVLNDNGFVNVRLYDWRETDHASHDDHSQAYFPHMDKENGTLISLNVECEKK